MQWIQNPMHASWYCFVVVVKCRAMSSWIFKSNLKPERAAHGGEMGHLCVQGSPPATGGIGVLDLKIQQTLGLVSAEMPR